MQGQRREEGKLPWDAHGCGETIDEASNMLVNEFEEFFLVTCHGCAAKSVRIVRDAKKLRRNRIEYEKAWGPLGTYTSLPLSMEQLLQ